MPNIENGKRYQTVKNELQAQEGVVIVQETTTERVKNKKNSFYEETRIAVAPESEQNVSEFTATLLTGIEPIFRHEADNGRLRTFDTLGERHYRPVIIDVFPSVDAARSTDK